jgi:DNA polymerase III subunit alpha
MKFAHLHCHSIFSLRDGLIHIGDLEKHAKENNFDAIAITDHGTISSFMELSKIKDIKLIYGIELYVNDKRKELLEIVSTINDKNIKKEKEELNRLKIYRDSIKVRRHLITLAKSRIGFNNLIKICNNSFTGGFYYSPLTDLDYINNHSKDLICTSACMAGEVASYARYDMKKAKTAVGRYKEIFGDDYYLEVIPIQMEEQIETNKALIELAKQTNTKIVFTKDCHYLNKKDNESLTMLFKIKNADKKSDEVWDLDAKDLYVATREQLLKEIQNHHKYIPNDLIKQGFSSIHEIIEKTQEYTIDRSVKIPHLKNAKQVISEALKKSLKEKNLYRDKKYISRLKHEMDIINEFGLIDYFYVVYDYCNYAHSQGIVLGPRGSAAGSLLCYLLGISDIDPIEHGLLFERFLNEKRLTRYLSLEI